MTGNINEYYQENGRRYHRQMLLPAIGEDGQRAIGTAHVLIAGCGALGCGVADALARAGIGRLTIVDRDIVESTNLQRQILYCERDADEGMPKAEAARRRLAEVNSEVKVRAFVDDINPGNIERFLEDEIDVIVDGLDNFETRYLLNDASVRFGIPYVYGGAVGTNGMTATFLPHQPNDVEWERLREGRARWDEETEATPCLRCVFPEAPPAGTSPTCDTAGVLGPIVSLIFAIESAEAIKILVGDYGAVNRDLLMVDVWTNKIRRMKIGSSRDGESCPCCGCARFEFLEGRQAGSATSLCGRNSVQVVPSDEAARSFDYEAVSSRLEREFGAARNEFLLKVKLPETDGGYELTIFSNGRVVVTGTDEVTIARSVYARYIGA